GIRDGHVTGVQTCALPISCVSSSASGSRAGGVLPRASGFRRVLGEAACGFRGHIPSAKRLDGHVQARVCKGIDGPPGRRVSKIRSEERRVGKESKYREWGM